MRWDSLRPRNLSRNEFLVHRMTVVLAVATLPQQETLAVGTATTELADVDTMFVQQLQP